MASESNIDEEDYASADDSDFAPDGANAPKSDASDAEDDVEEPDSKRQRVDSTNQAEDVGYDNSGDEAIIKKGVSRRRRANVLHDEDGGEGGLIKTRRQRAEE